MTPRTIQSVLRTLAESGPPVGDGELLRQFANDRNEAAFAELVRRHGRLVWAVCRHLSRSDSEADDAFQATFLVLLKNTATIRDAGKLSAWLHGVAYKVCAKARQAAKRRTIREHASAAVERNGSAIAESAWDRALAAVHEEVAKLPDTLRVPFVMCCLEGKGVTEAAEQVGWKLGTFSGRLTRAKNAILARLDARGLTVGVVAAIGLSTPPSAATARATSLAKVGSVIPNSILQLSQGVIGMSMTSIKVLAATVMVCGLGIGTGWLATAEAQVPEKPVPAKKSPPATNPNADDPTADVKRLQDELEKALLKAADADLILKVRTYKEEPHTAKTTKWEYDLVAVSGMDQSTFVKFLQDRENRGWEYNGMTSLNDGKQFVNMWIFRRPAGVRSYAPDSTNSNRYGRYTGATSNSKPEDVKAIEAELKRLQDKLAELRSGRIVFSKDKLPLEPSEFAQMLTKMAAKRFKAGTFDVAVTTDGIAIAGDAQFRDWAVGIVNKLTEK